MALTTVRLVPFKVFAFKSTANRLVEVRLVPLAFWKLSPGVYILVEVSEVPFAFAKLNKPERFRFVPVAEVKTTTLELRLVVVALIPERFTKFN